MHKFILLCAIVCLPGYRSDDALVSNEISSVDCVKPVLECPNEHVTFHLYSSSSGGSKILHEDKLADQHVCTGNPIKILIHDYRGHKDDFFNRALRAAYFRRGDYTIISVDYGRLVADPCFEQGANNVHLVGVCVANFLDSLADNKHVSPETLHIVGFGFGAHVAALSTNCLRSGRLGRITGLEPTMALFNDDDPTSKLTETDAIFVDVIHTNAGHIGQLSRLGQVDFYVNGGINQPSCDRVQDSDLCSHNMAPVYFAESITTPNGFWGTACRDTCGRRLGFPGKTKGSRVAVLMGEDVSMAAHGMFCVDTTLRAPYARGRCDPRRSHTLLYDAGGIIMVLIFLYFTVRYFYSTPQRRR